MASASQLQSKSLKAEDWQRLYAEWKQSNKPLSQFCQEKGLSYHAFGYWRRKLAKSSSDKVSQHILPLAIKKQLPSTPTQRGIKIVLPSGVIISISEEIEEKLLRLVLQWLAF